MGMVYISPEIVDQTPNSHSIGTNRRQLFTNSQSDNDPQLLILKELQKKNASISNLSNRLDSIENRLISVERKKHQLLIVHHQLKESTNKNSSMLTTIMWPWHASIFAYRVK